MTVRTRLLDREVGSAGHFDDRRPAHLIGLVIAITNWNRVLVSRRIEPGGCPS